MRLFNYSNESGAGLGIALSGGALHGLPVDQAGLAGVEATFALTAPLREALARLLTDAPRLDPARITLLPPVRQPGKILCVGLNYADHGREVGMAGQGYPTIFSRHANGLIGHGAALVRPRVSAQFDYEGELAVIIGQTARHRTRENALEVVAGYSIFNDGSVRDYQTRTTQWTMGKNFDGTGAFGPWLVTPEELPPGARGLRLRTRLNGQTVQDGNTDDFLFDVPQLIALLSEVMTLNPGDVIATGTPSGVGVARNPQLFMKPGDLCEIEIDGLGTLSNGVEDEVAQVAPQPVAVL